MSQVAEYYKREFQNQFIKKIKDIIIINCGRSKGENFKLRIPIMELIDYKNSHKSDGDKFQLYVITITSILEDLNACFPFVDLTNVSLDWTSQQIIDLILTKYNCLPKQ